MHGIKTQKANIHHGNLKTCIQKAPSMIPVLAGRSERTHVFYSSETIPPKMSRKKISNEAFSFKNVGHFKKFRTLRLRGQ
jgi:hypothetical protein